MLTKYTSTQVKQFQGHALNIRVGSEHTKYVYGLWLHTVPTVLNMDSLYHDVA